ncbi:hypothetical protein RhiJN_19103 [Ceratobasidium sp. AG-Ba]|nr:hypothetical protein RhiJN_19103 [Ceratobasidium sp. AG-Ba]
MQTQPSSSRRGPPGFLPLPRLDSHGWTTPTTPSAVTSPWEYGPPGASSEARQAPPALQPLRLSLLQHRADSAASMSANPPESPQPLSPLSPARFSRPDGSALGIIVPPGTPPADALPRWLADRRLSKQKASSPEARASSKGPAPRPMFDFPSYTLASPTTPYDWRSEPRPLVQTPGAIESSHTPLVVSAESYPFDLGAVTGERIHTPVEPRIRPRPLPRCSSDDMTDGRLFRINAWGEHDSPTDASNGLFSLMQSQTERARSRGRRLPPSRLASRAPSQSPTAE